MPQTVICAAKMNFLNTKDRNSVNSNCKLEKEAIVECHFSLSFVPCDRIRSFLDPNCDGLPTIQSSV